MDVVEGVWCQTGEDSMNKRIKELAEQSGAIFTDLSDGEELERFAELIVRECANIFEGVYTDQQRPERIDKRIKEHFGVE
jgi:hypothetical protein